MIGKERYSVPPSADLITTLFETSGFQRFSRIEPVETSSGRVAIGIFPTEYWWRGNFFVMNTVVLSSDTISASVLYARHDGSRIFEEGEKPIKVASFRVGDEIRGEKGLDLFPSPSDEVRKQRVMVKEALHRLAVSGSAYDPAKCVPPRDQLLRIMARGTDFGHPAILEAAHKIVSIK